MRILVTGVSGFIGSHMARSLAADGHDVIGCSRDADCCGAMGLAIDLCDFDALKEVLRQVRPELVVHCAGCANVSESVRDPRTDYQGNVEATQNLLYALDALDMASTRVLFLSSAGVYGNPESLPIPESAKMRPLSPYALHKSMSELACAYLNANHGFDVRVTRIFSAYGPGLRKQLFWDMACKLRETGRLDMWGTGNETRDYIYIDDLVEALKLVALDNRAYQGVFNVANGVETRIEDAARMFALAAGVDESVISFNGVEREGDPLYWRADVSRLRELGYRPSVPIDEGIRRYVEWAREEKDRQ